MLSDLLVEANWVSLKLQSMHFISIICMLHFYGIHLGSFSLHFSKLNWSVFEEQQLIGGNIWYIRLK